MPGAGHLTHMPSHVYWRVGQYPDAGRVNETAIQVDEATFRRGVQGADQGTHAFYSLSYYPHNIHFLFAASQMQGRSELAMTAARKLVAAIPEPAYREVPALEDFRPMPLFAMVRFGKWSEILAEPQPADDLQYTTGIWHWARGLAYVRQGDIDAAQREHEMVTTISQTDAMREQSLASFPKAATLLEIAALRARRRDRGRARQHGRRGRALRGGGRDPGRPGLHRAAGLVLPGAPQPRRGAAGGRAGHPRPRPSTART